MARDLLSGTIMAATSVPQLIAYAETVGYASYRGLATAGPPLAAWGMVTGSPFMNAGVTSVTALMARADLDGDTYLADHGEDDYVQVVAAYSLYIGLASIVMALCGFGKLAKSVPKSVAAGFKWGCACVVLQSALPNGFFAGGNSELKKHVAESFLGPAMAPIKGLFPGACTLSNILYAATHPFKWALQPTLLFVVGTLFILEGKNYWPALKTLPGLDVILLTVLATLYSMYGNYSGGIVGEIPAMDPDAGIKLLGGKLTIPVELLDMKKLLFEVPLVERCFGGSWLLLAISAATFAGVNFLSISAIASIFESENGISWTPDRELMGQGVACGVAAAVGSAPVSGSLSRSLVSRMTGTTSKMACIVTALCWIYLQPYMSIMTPTPKAGLSAVIVSAVIKGCIDPKAVKALVGTDAIVGWGTGLATLASTPTQGFAFGLVMYAVVALLQSQGILSASVVKPKVA